MRLTDSLLKVWWGEIERKFASWVVTSGHYSLAAGSRKFVWGTSILLVRLKFTNNPVEQTIFFLSYDLLFIDQTILYVGIILLVILSYRFSLVLWYSLCWADLIIFLIERVSSPYIVTLSLPLGITKALSLQIRLRQFVQWVFYLPHLASILTV